MRLATKLGKTVLLCSEWMGGSAVARACIPKSPNGRRRWEPVLVAVEQTTHVRREILDSADGLRQQGEGAHDEHLGTRNLPHRSMTLELAVERIGILDHLRIKQQRCGKLSAHRILSILPGGAAVSASGASSSLCAWASFSASSRSHKWRAGSPKGHPPYWNSLSEPMGEHFRVGPAGSPFRPDRTPGPLRPRLPG